MEIVHRDDSPVDSRCRLAPDPLGPRVVFRNSAENLVESAPENQIVVPDVLEHPHPLVARTVKTFRGAKRDSGKGFAEALGMSRGAVYYVPRGGLTSPAIPVIQAAQTVQRTGATSVPTRATL